MYKEYFGLKENPFNINTDPRYLYLTKGTQDALNCLMNGIEARKGFILLTGEVGTGKTTLLNRLLESLDQQRVASAFVFNPRLNASQFFEYMIADFGIQCNSDRKSRVLFALHQWLLNRFQAGEQTVLVVDEAQNLSSQALEEIRLLTNLETATEKLLQIVLAGQPEFEQKLNHRELRQLRQRIELRAKTLPLTPEETRGYILERLRIAGGNGEEIFSSEAIDAVLEHARGIPRITNLISDHALTRAFLEQRKPVSREIVEAVTREFSLDEGELLSEPSTSRRASSNGSNGHGRRRTYSSRALRRASARLQRRAEQPADGAPVGITQMKSPLFVYGYGREGLPFYEQTETIAANERGGLISMQTPVEPGQRILITNKETECSQECIVEHVGARLGRGVDVAFGFPVPTPQFWHTNETEKEPASESEQACA
jgi:type II secretory pathway predicted ATPase ExeA